MRSLKIPALEEAFKTTLRDSSGYTWKKLAKGEFSDVLPADKYIALGGKNSHYYSEATAKTHIAIHCTVGVLPGDVGTLGSDKKVSTPFIIARDGTIYQVFETKYWAFHLGLNSSGGNSAYSKRSVAIELSNIGPLKLVGDKLVDAYDVDYCSINDKDLYIQKNYRGYKYFATYTAKQQESLKLLVDAIAKKYKIKMSMPADPLAFSAAAPSTGLFFHQNTRADKMDPGPALDYTKII